VSGFHDVRLPDAVARGARGGPVYRTEVVTLASGAEQRNGAWANGRHEYDVGYGLRNADDLVVIRNFFHARRGRLHAFRFKDWGDWKSCLPSATPSATDQVLGAGDGVAVAFQLVKAYASGAQTYSRRITRPVAGTVLVSLNNVVQASGWSVNVSTGVLTFTTAPGAGVVVRAGFEFDVPVRFDTDRLDQVVSLARSGAIASLPLIEVRE
jgi:uncharacterized protein (TIGR02217 family)